MSMKRAWIVVFDEDVHRAILVIPAEVRLFLTCHGWPVEKNVESNGKVLADIQRRMIDDIAVVEERETRIEVIVIVVVVVVVIIGRCIRSR